ncbi:uncharacterized protein LOC130770929 [Actinidia eriantha]|uniref:uncharacterized protein LOC130770929 n=1 Tax=Actinidia eriantha TaxID=165200 RepID=UPI0025884F86|nr:uncharacterized protein LOC130770929 [Actinidia eriantha]XP_057484560.1 uncharacterized protein LOC130770929 [Actinidia eriantha]
MVQEILKLQSAKVVLVISFQLFHSDLKKSIQVVPRSGGYSVPRSSSGSVYCIDPRSRVSSCKVYGAVPRPHHLLNGVLCSRNEMKKNSTSAFSSTSSALNAAAIPPIPSAAHLGISTALLQATKLAKSSSTGHLRIGMMVHLSMVDLEIRKKCRKSERIGYSIFDSVWRTLYESRFGLVFVRQNPAVDWLEKQNVEEHKLTSEWQQMYWETHLQWTCCLDEAAQIALLPSLNGRIGEVRIPDAILKPMVMKGT